MDYATRYPEAVPLKNIDTETVAEALLDMYSRIGVPEEVLSDLGTQFASDCIKEVSRLLSIKRLTTSPYHPACNRLVEKFNGTLKRMLRRLCHKQPRQWHRFINSLLFAYREARQEATGFSSFELLYGRTVRGPVQILKEFRSDEEEVPKVTKSYQYVLGLRERLYETMKLAQAELEKKQGKNKNLCNRKAKKRSFQVGDKILVLIATDQNKLLIQLNGPFEIKGTKWGNNYQIEVNKKVKTYHINTLNLYVVGGRIEETATPRRKDIPGEPRGETPVGLGCVQGGHPQAAQLGKLGLIW